LFPGMVACYIDQGMAVTRQPHHLCRDGHKLTLVQHIGHHITRVQSNDSSSLMQMALAPLQGNPLGNRICLEDGSPRQQLKKTCCQHTLSAVHSDECCHLAALLLGSIREDAPCCSVPHSLPSYSWCPAPHDTPRRRPDRSPHGSAYAARNSSLARPLPTTV